MKTIRYFRAQSLLLFSLLFSTSSPAAVVISVQEVGADVVASFSGSLDLTGLNESSSSTFGSGAIGGAWC